MSKRNKLRYQSAGNQFPPLTFTGTVFLRYVDEEALEKPAKGDFQVYLSTDSLVYNIHVGDYEAMGHEGYLRTDIYDGKGWKPISLEELFSNREYYFSKRERPIDTYHLCLPILQSFAGREFMRTYREHYVLKPVVEEG